MTTETVHWCRCCGFISTDHSAFTFRHTDPDDPRNPALCPDCIRSELGSVRGVDAVFRSGLRLIAVVRELHEVDVAALIDSETRMGVEVGLRAHQGRSVESVLDGAENLL